MRKFYIENLKYDEWSGSPCEIHKIENKISITYDFKNLLIYYFYDKNESKNEFLMNLLVEIIKTDIRNMIFFNKIEFKISNLTYNNETELLNYNDYTENSTDSKIINKNLISNNNEIIIYFKLEEDKINDIKINDILKHYLWFMSIVRYVVDIYEEDDFYIQKEIKNRKKCHDYDELYQKLCKIHNINC